MSLFFRYIFSRIVISTITSTTVFLIILSTLSFLAELRDIENNYQFLNAGIYILLKLPANFVEVFPICAFIGSLLGLGNLAINNELIALETIGIGTKSIFRYAAISGLFLVLLVVLVGSSFAPRFDLYSRQYKSDLILDVSSVSGRQLWIKDNENFFRFSKADDQINIDQATIITSDNLDLQSVTRLTTLFPVDDLWSFGMRSTTIFNEDRVRNQIDINGSTEYLSITRILDSIYVREDLLALPVLYEYMNFFEESGMNDSRYAYAFWYRLGFFFSVLVMVIGALPFVMGSMRFINTGTRLTLGLTLGIGYFIFIRLLASFGQLYNLEPFIMMMSPHILLLLMLYYYFARSFEFRS